MTTQLFVDSTAYLTKENIERYQIQVLSLSVHFQGDAPETSAANGESYLETQVDYDYFYKKLTTANALPTSSQPNIHHMQEAFSQALSSGKDLFVLTLSSDMSGTYQTAKLVLDELQEIYPNRVITLVDSRSNCMQLGFQALSAAETLASGKDHSDALIAVFRTQAASRFIFIADTLKYLEKGGRIGKASAFLGTLLNIKPILTVQDGRTDAIAKVRTRQKALEVIADRVAKDVSLHGFRRACIHHIDNPEGVKALVEALPHEVAKDIPIVSIGPVIGTHVGPGAVGIVYETYGRL